MRIHVPGSRLARLLAIAALPMLAACGNPLDSCGIPDSWETVTGATVVDVAGAPMARARVTLLEIPELHDDRYSGSLRIVVTGLPSPDSSGGPLAGWVDAVRLEDAQGVLLARVEVQRGYRPNVFHPTGATIDEGARLRAVRTALRGGRAVLRFEMIDDPQAPTPGPAPTTLQLVEVNRFEGLCT